MTPQRIQLRRTKGYRKPEGAIVVARPTQWGNPFPIAGRGRCEALIAYHHMMSRTSEARAGWIGAHFHTYPSDSEIRAELAGHDLACWCALGDACHADTLLAIANRPNTVVTATGLILSVHSAEVCRPPCPIHAPTDHPMRGWPKLWRDAYFERLCEHGVGHPDPDSMAYFERLGLDGMGVHGCDGCCSRRRR